MILCEKCNNYDYEGFCESPSVISTFGNFFRKYKCKYYRRIKYGKLLLHMKRQLKSLIYYGRNRMRGVRRFRYLPLGVHILWEQEHYFNLRDYLFQIGD